MLPYVTESPLEAVPIVENMIPSLTESSPAEVLTYWDKLGVTERSLIVDQPLGTGILDNRESTYSSSNH